MTKRLITKRQEQVLKLCHQDFSGLSQAEAARQLDILQSTISNILKRIKKVLPQYFPILTKLEAERYHLYAIQGWSVDEIAKYFGLTSNSVYKALQRARDKGMCFTKPKGRVLSYSSEMDASIKERL